MKINFNPFKKFIDDTMDSIKPEDKAYEGEAGRQAAHADSIIRNHIMWSIGAGFIPVAIADFLAVSGIQLDMIRQLCNVYDQKFSETEGKAVIASLTGSVLARMGASAIKLIPGVGSVIGGVSMSVMAGASTYALGEVFKTHFSSGGTFLDLDPARMKHFYQEKFEKGKKVAADLKEQAEREKAAARNAEANMPGTDAATDPIDDGTTADPVQQLKELAKLRKKGIITDAEFEQMKGRIIGG